MEQENSPKMKPLQKLLPWTLLIGLLVPIHTHAAPAARPNILFIAIDDLNDWVGCMGGHPQAKTPHIDKLAADGVLFRNAYAAAPSCNPSRAAVFSGRAPWRTDRKSVV